MINLYLSLSGEICIISILARLSPVFWVVGINGIFTVCVCILESVGNKNVLYCQSWRIKTMPRDFPPVPGLIVAG